MTFRAERPPFVAGRCGFMSVARARAANMRSSPQFVVGKQPQRRHLAVFSNNPTESHSPSK